MGYEDNYVPTFWLLLYRAIGVGVDMFQVYLSSEAPYIKGLIVCYFILGSLVL